MIDYINDNHDLAVWLDMRNRARQYDFMETAFLLWQHQERPHVSLKFIQELNFYAAHLLTDTPGTFRSQSERNVDITNTPHTPPKWQVVDGLMDEFLIRLHRTIKAGSPLESAAYALWRLNWIHPFVQGNGRTSRALCYFILCQMYDLWLPGSPILPELIKQNRDEYCDLLRAADAQISTQGETDLEPLQDYLGRLLHTQLASTDSES